MRLIITRHGETEENKAGVMQGHLPGKLSATGVDQARKIALRLKDEKIDYIFSSDLARAHDTAKEIAKFHPQAIVETTEELRERDLGEFQGKRKSDLGWNTKDFKAILVQPKNGEKVEELCKRAESFLHRIIAQHKNDTVLLIGHNGINKALLAVATGEKNIGNIENQHNTSLNILEIDEDKNHKILCSNCTKHLN